MFNAGQLGMCTKIHNDLEIASISKKLSGQRNRPAFTGPALPPIFRKEAEIAFPPMKIEPLFPRFSCQCGHLH